MNFRGIGCAALLALGLLLSACGGGGGSGGASSDTAVGASSSTSSSSSAVAIVAAGNTGLLNDTGITAMGYDAAGAYLGTCAGVAAGNDCKTGRDVTASANSDGHAGFSFTKIAADGSALPASATEWSCVKDNVTGYIWESKTAANSGLSYVSYDGMDGVQALKNAVNAVGLCGAKDWRVPTVDELLSIVDDSVANSGPTIDANWFPNTPQKGFWSSSAYRDNDHTLVVEFTNGSAGNHYRGDKLAVRLVRSAQSLVSNRYQISSDSQEVTDTQTGLIWRRCAEGWVWSGGTCTFLTTSAYAYRHADALLRAASEASISGKAWRLPNKKELSSILDRSRSSPMIDITVFPTTPSTWFWSSSAFAGDSSKAWGVDFEHGNVRGNDRSYSSWVRLVRSGQ